LSIRHYFIMFIIVTGILFNHQTAKAQEQEPFSREETLEFLKEAFEAQTSLGEKYQTYKQARETLQPYLTDDYAKKFLHENLVHEEDGYTIYGSDFALYFIPFYSYSDETKFVYDEEDHKIYVYELFLKTEEGPVHYEDHYETVILTEDQGQWKVSEFINSEAKPDFIKNLEERTDSKKKQEQTKLNPEIFQGVLYSTNRVWGSYFILQMEYRNQIAYVTKKEPKRFLFCLSFQ
jgi:hypothetical protein